MDLHFCIIWEPKAKTKSKSFHSTSQLNWELLFIWKQKTNTKTTELKFQISFLPFSLQPKGKERRIYISNHGKGKDEGLIEDMRWTEIFVGIFFLSVFLFLGSRTISLQGNGFEVSRDVCKVGECFSGYYPLEGVVLILSGI